MSELEKRLRELHDANPINEGEDVESCWGDCWIEDMIREAARIGAEHAEAKCSQLVDELAKAWTERDTLKVQLDNAVKTIVELTDGQ